VAASPSRLQIHRAYRTSQHVMRTRVQLFVNNAWGSLDSWRAPDIERFARRVAPVVAGGQRQMAAMTDGYLAQMTGARTVGVPPKLVTSAAMRGADTMDVYMRSGPTVWRSLASGSPLQAAVLSGLNRMLSTAATDLQLAKTHSSRYVLERSATVTSYLRVPEDDACDFCLLASTQRYHAGDLMPLHSRCGCDVDPFEDTGPAGRGGQVQNDDLRQQLQDKGVVVHRGDGKKDFYGEVDGAPVGVAVHEHGELGPVLTKAGDHFTGEHDLDD
jgi:hypothetical protein